ncbi:hypothetical protein SRHO_G00128060 [Serrasalmus rhombeus]
MQFLCSIISVRGEQHSIKQRDTLSSDKGLLPSCSERSGEHGGTSETTAQRLTPPALEATKQTPADSS